MSLFVINRYEGEKQEEKNEKQHLSELLKRIEERKQERLAKIQNQQTQKAKHKKKKKKIEANNNETEHAIPMEDSAREFKKKKRKIDEGVHTEEDNINDATTELKDEKKPKENIGDQENRSFNKSEAKELQKTQTDFMVLGEKKKGKKQEVKRVLPEWLANPNIISIDLNSGPSMEEMGSTLDSNLVEVLRANGIKKLFPVQASMMSWLTKCNKDREQGWWLRDTCVSAPTGSGKTLAYVLPIVQILQSRLVPKIRCLVVVPVQELASQVYKVMHTYASHTNLRVALLSGASAFEQEQSSILKKNAKGEFVSLVDIIVATPGRLIDHILKTSGFSLDDLRFLVIDEADKAADWLEYLPEPHYQAPRLTLHNMRCSKVPAQKLLFSATLSQDPEKLNRLGLFHPILFTSVLVTGKDEDVNLDTEVGDFIGRYTSPEVLTEQAVECAAELKPVALYQLVIKNKCKTLVFTNSGETAHRLTILLQSLLSEENIKVGELSAQLNSKEREKMLKKLVTGEIQILVSSDALSRGVDIPDVQLVVSYDLPKHIKGYIHRAGRTGRAGKAGTAISVLLPKQVGIFKHMLSNAHKTVPEIEKLELESVVNEINYSKHIETLRETLKEEKQSNLLRAKSVKRVQSMITL